VLCISCLNALLNARLHAQALLSIGPPSLIATAAPAVAALAGGVIACVLLAGTLAVIVLIARRLSPHSILAPLALVALLAAVSQEVRTPGELALQYGMVLLTAAGAFVFCLWFSRSNYLAYVLVFGIGAAHSALAELIHSGNARLEMQGWVVAGVVVAAVAWATIARKSGLGQTP